jgi:hypothetical protein
LLQQETREPLLARTEKLIHDIAFDSTIPVTQMVYKKFREPRLVLKSLNHRGFLDCSPSATMRQIEGLHEGRISGSS